MFLLGHGPFGASLVPRSTAGLFLPPGLFPSPFRGVGAGSTGGGSAGPAHHGIFGSRGIRLPGVGGVTELALNVVLAGVLALSLGLLGLSATPAKVFERTPVSVERFQATRPYLVTLAASILLSGALVYGLASAVP